MNMNMKTFRCPVRFAWALLRDLTLHTPFPYLVRSEFSCVFLP